jgi:hypothetical protein
MTVILMTPEVLFMLLQNVYSTDITYDRQNILIEQAKSLWDDKNKTTFNIFHIFINIIGAIMIDLN